MALSGSRDWSLGRDEVIEDALFKVGAVELGDSPSPSQIRRGMRALNAMIKSWQARNIGIWLIAECTLWLNGGQYYLLGPSGDHCTATAHKTQIATAASSGDGTIDVDSDDDISNGDAIGIELDDGTLQWTTVNGAPSGDTVTLAAVLTDDVAVDNYVHSYTTMIPRPTHVLQAWLRNEADSDRPVDIISRTEYNAIPTKSSSTSPTMACFAKELTQAKLFVWPIGGTSTVNERIMFLAKFDFQDLDDYDDDFEFPVAWTNALIWNLAYELSFEYRKKNTAQDRAEIFGKAQKELMDARMMDGEESSIRFTIDTSRR